MIALRHQKSESGENQEESDSLFVVWNDRPQAGVVQYDSAIKLLVDRRVNTVDSGGVDEIFSDT